jgi:hypothetical protein
MNRRRHAVRRTRAHDPFWRDPFPYLKRTPPATFSSVPEGAPEAEIITAYYATWLGVAQSIRERARAGFTIASAFGTALIAAGVFGELEASSKWVKTLATASLISWAVTAWTYLQASSGHILDRDQPYPHEAKTAEEFAEQALTQAARTQFWLERRMEAAMIFTAIAFLATILTFVTTLWFP